MKFGEAVELLKEGNLLIRDGWNGKNMFVFRQVPSEINVEIVPKMTSLPEKVKLEFVKRGLNLKYTNQFAIVKPDNTIDSWVPSVSDTLAEDWLIY